MPSISLLNDGQYEGQYVSFNNWEVLINFQTDQNTGADPFRSAIPNPPISTDWAFSWGQDYEFKPGDLKNLIPQKPIPHNPPVDPTPGPGIVPEPSYIWIVLSVIGYLIFNRWRKTCAN